MPDFDPTSYKNEFNREHYVSLSVRMTREEKALVTNAASYAGKSLREYILGLIPSDYNITHETCPFCDSPNTEIERIAPGISVSRCPFCASADPESLVEESGD